jgi:hypothetical protein
MPQRVQLSRKKGWRMPPNTVKVDRTTKWGNPFLPMRGENKEYCATLFKYMAAGYICLSRKQPTPEAQLAYLRMAKKNIRHLRGKNLACWCALDAACHADTLLKIAKRRRR